MKLLLAFFSPWTWRMAWRDSRASRRKLLLFSCSIVLGVAALVAINSFSENLRVTVDEQAKSLLGADLAISSRDPFTPEAEALFKRIGGIQAREVVFSSMATFLHGGGTRLVQVRALQPGFPFYGNFETTPAAAATNFFEGAALVEETLLFQFDSKPGDSVRIGRGTFTIAGSLQKIPGENAVFSTIAPRIYIPLSKLDTTGLMENDSFARYKIFFKLPASTDVEKLVRIERRRIEDLKLSVETVAERKNALGRSMENLNRFLNLGGFIALLLGAIGIASAIHVHVRQKTGSIAALRCLGSTIGQTFAIYLAQAAALGLAGTACGCILGLAIQHTLPRVAADFLPFQVSVQTMWIPVLRAVAAGFAVSILFAVLPLLSIRRISPLAVLRSLYEPGTAWRDPAHWVLLFVMAAGLLWLAHAEVGRWRHALGFTAGLAGAFLLLTLFAQALRRTARAIISAGWPFAVRQGMANLYRPQNRTLLLLLSLGLGVFLMLTLYRTSQLLSRGLLPANRANEPNAALFDVQADQVEPLKKILAQENLPVLADVPLVTMRLVSIKGEPVRKLLRSANSGTPRWALRREYRCTYRDTLDDSETLVAGNWPPKEGKRSAAAPIPVSVEEGIARDLKVGIGDEFVFDLQGVLLTNRVESLRRVDWKRIQPNFFVVFPTGVLEDAPGFHILTTRTPSREASANMQKAVVKALPNVSIIDLALVLDTIDSILDKVSFVFRFMALFTVATGLIVLVASVLTGRYQRIQETILLRTLGASRRQVRQILISEYLLLGLLSAVAGAILAEGGAWALTKYLFKAEFHFAILPSITALVLVSGITVLAGMFANRGVLDRPPLEVLRDAA